MEESLTPSKLKFSVYALFTVLLVAIPLFLSSEICHFSRFFSSPPHAPPTTKPFYSTYQCNKYQHAVGHPAPPHYPHHTLFAQCSLTNLCLRRDGKWQLFLDEKTTPFDGWLSAVNGTPWVYAQPIFDSPRGNLPILLNPSGAVKLLPSSSSCQSGNCYPLAEDFMYIREPAYLTYRYAADNVSHLILDAMTQMTIDMVMFQQHPNPAMHIVFLDDLQDVTQINQTIGSGRDAVVADRLSREFFSLLTTRPIQQLCRGPHGWSVAMAPCRNEVAPSSIVNSEGEGAKLRTCFQTAVLGMSRPYTVDPIGAEVINEPLRKLVGKVTGLDFQVEPGDKNSIVVAVAPGRPLLGPVIENWEAILRRLAELKEESVQKIIEKEIEIMRIDFDDMSAQEQVEVLARVDVLLVAQPTDGHRSMFLPRNAVLIQAPVCDYYNATNITCHDRLARIVRTFSHVRVHPFLSLLPPGQTIECRPRPTKAVPTQCDPVLPVETTYSVILSSIKDRYKRLIYQKRARQKNGST